MARLILSPIEEEIVKSKFCIAYVEVVSSLLAQQM